MIADPSPVPPRFVTIGLTIGTITWAVSIPFTLAIFVLFQINRCKKPSLRPYSNFLAFACTITVLAAQLLGMLAQSQLVDDWSFVCYFTLFSALVEAYALINALHAFRLVIQWTHQKRMQNSNYLHQSADELDHPIQFLRQLQSCNIEATDLFIIRCLITGICMIIILQVGFILAIAHILTPRAVVRQPALDLLLLSGPCGLCSAVLSYVYMNLFRWLKDVNDAYKIKQQLVRCAFITAMLASTILIITLASFRSYPYIVWNWYGDLQGHIAVTLMTAMYFIQYGQPLFLALQSYHFASSCPSSPLLRVSSNRNSQILEISSETLLADVSGVSYHPPLSFDHHSYERVMTNPEFFRDFQAFAARRLNGEPFAFLERRAAIISNIRKEWIVLRLSADIDPKPLSTFQQSSLRKLYSEFISPNGTHTLHLPATTFGNVRKWMALGDQRTSALEGLDECVLVCNHMIYNELFLQYVMLKQ